MKKNKPIEAEKEYKEALKIYEELANDNPSKYRSELAKTYHILANLHSSINNEDADDEYNAALNNFNKAARINQDVSYGAEIANVQRDYAQLLAKNEVRIDEAIVKFQKALSVFQSLAEKDPTLWQSEVDKTQKLLTDIIESKPKSLISRFFRFI